MMRSRVFFFQVYSVCSFFLFLFLSSDPIRSDLIYFVISSGRRQQQQLICVRNNTATIQQKCTQTSLVRTKAMFSAVARRTGVIARAAAVMRPQPSGAAAAAVPALRAGGAALPQVARFSGQVGDGGIADIHDTGRQKDEREGATFNRDPIHPPKGSGTKAMPFEVPSEHKERVVGFEHPDSHAMYWFPLAAGKLHYVEEIDRYFKLVPL